MDYLSDLEQGLYLLPEQVSEFAASVDYLYFGLILLSAILVLILIGLIAAFGWRYRAANTTDRKLYLGEHVSRRLELSVAVVMFVAFLGLFAWASSLYLDAYRGPADAATINVIGKQWMWKVQHPDGTREINTIHVPVGRKIRLRMTSQDVIHSFYIPALRLKRDVLPGNYTKAWFTADKPGEYWLFCAEYCGMDHSRMRGKMVVMKPSAYEAWLNEQGDGPAPEVAGEQLFVSYGCSGCHRGRSAIRAPSLAGIHGRTVPLASGGTTVADEAYLRDSILRPQKHVVAGYEPVMPSFSGQIPESEILQIIAYLKSLEAGDWQYSRGAGNEVTP
jgi:cytochrome c oxidase subunit 2